MRCHVCGHIISWRILIAGDDQIPLLGWVHYEIMSAYVTTRYTSRTPNLHPKALWLRWKQMEPMFYLFTWRLPAFLTTSQRHSAIQARLQVVSPVPSPAVWEQDYVETKGPLY